MSKHQSGEGRESENHGGQELDNLTNAEPDGSALKISGISAGSATVSGVDNGQSPASQLRQPFQVLVVDDTPANLKLLDALLRKKGYQARLFPRGELALKAAAVVVPDLVLLDVMMPGMDGYEVCRRLKALPGLADVPVIFISALSDVECKVRAFEEGGVDYVTKPFEEVEVLARVDTHLALGAIRRELQQQYAALEQLVRERTEDLLRAQRVARVGSWKLDFIDETLEWSPETYRLFGIPENTDVTLHDFLDKVHSEDRQRVEQAWVAACSGQSYEIEHRIQPPAGALWVRERAEFDLGSDGHPVIAWGTVQDISEIKSHEAHVEFITHHDVLTGLPNRACFLDYLRVCMATCVTMRARLAVAYIDIDGFASVNDRVGREHGDQLIVRIARRLADSVRDSQYLARIGGDEFAVILTDLGSPDSFVTPVRRMLQAVAEPLKLDGAVFQVTASIGVASFPQASVEMEAEQLLRQADQAMYLAKLTGKNRFHLFDPIKDESARERFMRIDEVRKGLHAGQMKLYFQPKVWLSTGKVAGFEALIRWLHPERGLVPPGQFIPLLEQHPMAIELGNWVMEAALAQLATWNAEGLQTTVSVNVDAEQLSDPDFVARLAEQLDAQPSVSPTQLELEILETGALDSVVAESEVIARVRKMGVACSLDDFGTGFSSLTFLKNLEAQTIKIDQSFVRGMLDDAENVRIIHSVIGLARSFDRHTLAEGVESFEHGRMLLELGCEMAQGYVIARPMPASDVPGWLSVWSVPEHWRNVHELNASDVFLLFAEVEHRSWLSALSAYVKSPAEQQLPPLDERECRFGQWLNLPSTVRRLGSSSEYDRLVLLHERFHAIAAKLVADVEAGASDPDSWAELYALRAQLCNALHALRSQTGDLPS